MIKTREWIERRQLQGYFRIVQRSDGIPVGFVQISSIHRKNRHGWMGIAICSSERGKGFGRQAVTAVTKAASEELNLRKLLLEVRQDNATAIEMYKNLGWRNVGHLEKHYDDGSSFHDVLLFEKLLEIE